MASARCQLFGSVVASNWSQMFTKDRLLGVKYFQVFTKDKAVLGASACVHAILGRGEECQLTDESQGFKSGNWGQC